RRVAVQRIRRASGCLDLLLAAACGAIPPANHLLDRLAAAVNEVPFLGYLYFETAAEYLMLHSTSRETAACAQAGELNNHLYKRLAFTAVDTMGHLFDLALFHPDHDRLQTLIDQLEPNLVPGAADYISRRVAHLFACAALDPSVDATTV